MGGLYRDLARIGRGVENESMGRGGGGWVGGGSEMG